MKSFRQIVGRSWIGALTALFLSGAAFAQTSTSGTTAAAATPPVADPALQGILQQRLALIQQEQALRSQGANPQALAAWHQQHAADFAAVNQKLQAWSASQPAHAMPMIREVTVPDDATPEMQEFLTNRAQLMNSLAQLHNQALKSGTFQGNPAAGSSSIISQWHQQNAALLQRQQQLSQTLSTQSAWRKRPVPSPTPVPSNASPQLKAFLTARNELMRGEIQTRNQYATADAATRQTALQQWRQQNAAKFQKLQQLAQTLTQTQTAAPIQN
jgi:hypothetical protein